MTAQSACRIYELPLPLEKTAKQVRQALAEAGLAILSESDLSHELRRHIHVELAPCLLMLVYSPLSLLQVLTLHPSAAVFLPVHLVLAKSSTSTEAYLLDPRSWNETLNIEETAPLLSVQLSPILKCLDRVATRRYPAEHAIQPL